MAAQKAICAMVVRASGALGSARDYRVAGAPVRGEGRRDGGRDDRGGGAAVDRAFGGPETLDRRKRRTVWDAGRSGSVVKGEHTWEDSRGYFKIAWENLRCFAT